jgi:hypothetical protein
MTHIQKRTSSSTGEATMHLILHVNFYRLQDIDKCSPNLVDRADTIFI